MGSENGCIQKVFAKRALLVAGLLGSVSCAADMGAEDIGVVKAAVEDGTILTGEQASHYNGVVRIWARNAQFDEMRQFCGGVLITNTIVATAAHCLQSPEAVAYGWPDVSEDTSALTVSTNVIDINSQGVGAPIYAPDGRDLAVFKIDRPLPVRSRGEYTTSGFFHNLGGTPESDAWVATVGYGELERDVRSDRCKYVSKTKGPNGEDRRLRGCIEDPFELNLGLGTPFPWGVEILNRGISSTPGDSGGPTLLVDGSADFADYPIIGINSLANRCVDTPEGEHVCGAVSARVDDLKTWFAAIAGN